MYQSDYVTHLEGYIKHQYALQHWPKFFEGSLKFVLVKIFPISFSILALSVINSNMQRERYRV